jgi:hypothetical protein
MININLDLSSTVIISVFHKSIRIHLKSPASWDITPCSTLKLNRRFGRRVASILRAEELCLLPAPCRFPAWLILRPED